MNGTRHLCHTRNNKAFETLRIRASPISPSDAQLLRRIHSDARVMATLGGVLDDAASDRVLLRMLTHWESHGYGAFVLRSLSDGRFMGRAGLMETTVADETAVEVFYALLPEYWGRGYGSEIAASFVDYARLGLRVERLAAFALVENAASRRVLEKVGFTYRDEVVKAELPHARYRLVF